MNNLDPLLLVGIFIAAGVASIIRFLLAKWNGALPWGILTANIIGSFFAGYSINLFPNNQLLTLITIVGFAGGLSTFSSWAAGTVELQRKHKNTLDAGAIILEVGVSALLDVPPTPDSSPEGQAQLRRGFKGLIPLGYTLLTIILSSTAALIGHIL